LRYSDLKRLSKLQLQKKEQHYYLDVRAAKTQIETRMLLPSYCVDIFQKYLKRGDHLLPQISLQYFNRKVKELSELIPENDYLHKVRERKGKTIIRQKDPKTQRKLKLSDHISSHTMRRTAISIMLESGMDEILVRRISGHAPNSKEFYRYVRLAQHRLDAETTRVLVLRI
jgi:integrase